MYLGVFLAAFLLAQTNQRRQRFGEGIAIALAGVAILALATRLLPHVFNLSFEETQRLPPPIPARLLERRRDPLLVRRRDAALDEPPLAARRLRWISVGALPAVLLALYFTHSRGGILTLLVAAGTLIVLSRDRLWYLGTLLIAAVLTLPAVVAIHSYDELSNNFDFPGIVDQGLKAGGGAARR